MSGLTDSIVLARKYGQNQILAEFLSDCAADRIRLELEGRAIH
jgi:hypothetical protein